MKASLKNKKGQNTAEYMIMLTLVAVASIGLFSVFGQTMRQKVSQVANAIGGNSVEYGKDRAAASKSAKDGSDRAKNKVDMQGIDKSELESGATE